MMAFLIGNLGEAIRSSKKARTMCWLSSILVYTGSFSFAQTPSPSSASTANRPASLQPFFSANCFLCHNSQAKTAGLDLQSYVGKSSFLDDRITGEKILKKLQAGEMPPAGMPRPSDADLKNVIKQLQDAFETAEDRKSVV